MELHTGMKMVWPIMKVSDWMELAWTMSSTETANRFAILANVSFFSMVYTVVAQFSRLVPVLAVIVEVDGVGISGTLCRNGVGVFRDVPVKFHVLKKNARNTMPIAAMRVATSNLSEIVDDLSRIAILIERGMGCRSQWR